MIIYNKKEVSCLTHGKVSDYILIDGNHFWIFCIGDLLKRSLPALEESEVPETERRYLTTTDGVRHEIPAG